MNKEENRADEERKVLKLIEKEADSSKSKMFLISMGIIAVVNNCSLSKARNIRDRMIAEHSFITNKEGKMAIDRKGFKEWFKQVRKDIEKKKSNKIIIKESKNKQGKEKGKDTKETVDTNGIESQAEEFEDEEYEFYDTEI